MTDSVPIAGVPIHFEVRGSGRPILMLHGFAVDRHSMIGCMEPVFAHRPGWQRIYLDLPGMGETPGAPHLASADALRDMILAFADHIVPGQSFAIAGKSYGGYLARGITAQCGDRVDGAALICPAVVAARDKRDVPRRQAVARDEALLTNLAKADAEEFTPYFTVQDARTWERFRDEILPGVRRADLRSLAAISRQYAFSNEPAQLFTRPAVLLTGRQDGDVGYRDCWNILESYPRASYAVLDRAAHNLEIEQDRLFEALIGEWLNRVVEATPR